MHNDTADDLMGAICSSSLKAHALERMGSGFDGHANRAREDALDRRLELAELWGCSLDDLPAEAVRRGYCDPEDLS
jgi:hypothetical protein